MPGVVTEPKTSAWKATAQNVEERIKFKNNDSRIALPLHNAKIHRPGLYLPANRAPNCSNSSESTAQLDTTFCNRNSSKTKSSKRADMVKCKGICDSKPNRSETLSSDASGRTVSKLDSRILRCSCKVAMDPTECKKSGNPLEEAGGNLAKTVKLKVVNVNPWTNDGVKTARIVEPHLAYDNGHNYKSPKRNLTRLVPLLQEYSVVKHCSSAGRETADRTPLCQADDRTVQQTSQKLPKPGRIVCSHGDVSQDCHMGENCLSGILRVTSKIPSNPWPFQQLPLAEKASPNKVKSDFSMFERGPRLSTMKRCCHLCEECRKIFQNASLRVHGPDMESENLTRLKYKLKLKERELLNVESNFGKTMSFNSNELEQDEPTKCKLGEKFTLPKLYLTHHSTTIADRQKAKKTRTKKTVSNMSAPDECSHATKHRCCKLAKVERLDSASFLGGRKLAKNSVKIPKVQGSFSAVLMPTTPLRGFTPLCLTESPMLWRENESGVQGIEQEKQMAIQD